MEQPADRASWPANPASYRPLSLADRRAATERIIASHPQMSDRAIGHSAGLAANTVAGIRKRSGDVPQWDARVGRDGRVRPLNSEQGRRRAAELLARQPEASLRDVARAAGISPSTVLDVRKRLERDEPAVPNKRAASRSAAAVGDLASVVDKLVRDPSLRDGEGGKAMLRLHVNAATARQVHDVAAGVPPHCVAIVMQLARQHAKMWQDFADELNGR